MHRVKLPQTWLIETGDYQSKLNQEGVHYPSASSSLSSYLPYFTVNIHSVIIGIAEAHDTQMTEGYTFLHMRVPG